MKKATVLGGCGGIGSVAVRTLASSGYFESIAIAESRYDEACRMAEAVDPRIVAAVEVDAGDPESVKRAVDGSQVVLNCVGPFYRFGPTVLEAVIDAGIDYVDVCDDLDATEKMLALDEKARRAGVSALIGMGNSPGLANVLARWCADEMLTEVEAVDIYHAHGGEPLEGAGVVKHRIHAMTSSIPLFVDGEFIEVRMLEESGRAFIEETEFKNLGTFPVFPYPHPETITIPRFLEGVRRVTNKGFVLPEEYFRLTMDAVELGICTEDPLVVGGREILPIDFAVEFILSRRPALLEAAGLTEPTGCLKVSVRGRKETEEQTYVFSMYSKGAGAGEGTGIPAALGTMLMVSGDVSRKGVFPPEAGVAPLRMLSLAGEVMKGTGMSEEVPLYIDHIGGDGKTRSIDFKI